MRLYFSAFVKKVKKNKLCLDLHPVANLNVPFTYKGLFGIIYMVTLMVGTFIFGYILIAIEHKIQINKAAVAVTLGMLLWVMYCSAPH